MSPLPIRDLIVGKPRPLTTLSLVPQFEKAAKEMVETYVFTDAIRARFEEILDTVARGQGQGFWVQAEYGAGKTHFLVVLAALLSGPDGAVWASVADEEVRAYQRRMGGNRLFPVLVSLRGEGGTDPFLGRTLLDVLLEEGFQRALEHAGLADRVQVTSAEDLSTWLGFKASPAIRREAEQFIQQRTGRGLEAYRDDEGTQPLGRLIAEYCASAGIKPEIATSVKARLAHIYEQLTRAGGPGYDGLLVVVDEYEGWQKNHNSEEELSNNAELLETLAYLLPRDLGCRVFTVVASQSGVPAKLSGEQQGDRFVNIPLLAQGNEHDYDVIISRRVRALNEARLPEINDHFQYCAQHFEFARNLTVEQFYDTFPFQPRCFEVVRRITARDLPTARSGLSVFWETVNVPALLDRSTLIRAADLMTSPHLVEDCLATTDYQESLRAYRAACEGLDLCKLEQGDLALARDVLTTLFLWHLAYLEAPRRINMQDLAQATLTTDDFMRAEDNVRYVLSQIQALDQIDFDNETAQFVPTAEGPVVVRLFDQYKQDALRNRYGLQSAWSESLFFSPQETEGAAGLFSEFPANERATRRAECRHLEYTGEVVVSTGWRLDLGMPLPKEDQHFRLVILTPTAAQSVRAEQLQDPRIAVVLPGDMTDETRDAAAAWLAWHAMQEAYKDKGGRDAEMVRAWLANQRRTILGALTNTHLKLYQAGRVITRDDLAISARDAFGRGGGNDARLSQVVEQLLTAAYPQLPFDAERLKGTLTSAEAGKVFAGYFDKTPAGAAVAAARNFGVALGLSHPDQPAKFSPQSPRAFELMEAMLTDRGGADLPCWQVYDRLSGMPFGLPYVVVQLYLLALVRQGLPPRGVDLLLSARHTLRTRDRQPLVRDRLTAGIVADLEWKPGLEANLNALVLAVGPTWNDALPWVRELADGFRQSTDQADVEAQTQRLGGEIETLREDVGTQRRALGVLATALAGNLPAAATQALDSLERLATDLPPGYGGFYERAGEVFDTGPEGLRGAMQTFTRLKSLSGVAAEIAAARRYLDDVTLRAADRDLAADRMTQLAQLSLEALVESPESWNRLREETRAFKARYQNTYQKHHRDYYAALAGLREELSDAPRRLRALGLLNRVEGLGRPLGDDLQGRFDALQGELAPCPLTKVTDVVVERAPTCDRCPRPLRLTDEAPKARVQSLVRALNGALDDKRRQLASEAISRVLARGGSDDMATFLEAVRASDLAALVDVMSPELAEFIEKLLADEAILIVESDALSQLARRFSSLEEGQVEEAVEELRRLLRASFAAEREAHPDKKTVRLSLRPRVSDAEPRTA